jgi:hypothetical protein
VLQQGSITFVLISPVSGLHPESSRLITHGDGKRPFIHFWMERFLLGL